MNETILQNGFMKEGDRLDVRSMRPYLGMKQNASVRQNALLRKTEWEEIDRAVVDVMRQPIVGVSDLIAAGLTKPLGGLGTSISTYEQLTDMSDADVSMTITPRKGDSDRPAFEPQSIPVPIISKPFYLDARSLDASRRSGEGLDVTSTRVATIKVREALEAIVFAGHSKQLAGFKIYGYTNHPNRKTDTAANFGGGDWGTDGNAHKTIVGMINAMAAWGFYGPWGLYVADTQYGQTLQLTGANKSETQLSVIQRTIPDLRFVRRSSRLTDGHATLVQLTSDVVDLAIGQDVIPVQWAEEGGLVAQFRILTAAVPRVKFNADGHAGVCHVTGC
jgi:uncharacterized linocin/CFP29 family protein